MERINDPNAEESSLIPSSPRSVESCFLLGIDPIELQFHPVSWYRRQGEDEDIARIRYEKCEGVRQERMRSLMDQRKFLIDDGWTPGDIAKKGPGGNSKKANQEDGDSSMVEKERLRLEALKRRQEKDLQQMIQFEVQRKELQEKQQKKVDEMERRAQELVRQKLESDVAWAARQREFELQKHREEKEMEREVKRMAEERNRREKEIQAREAEEDKRRKKEAYERDLERRQKAEDARRETEAILAVQAEEVRLRKLDMERKDAERLKRMELEAKQLALSNAEKRKKAELRIASALTQSQEITARKRSAFQQRESANEARRRQMEEMRRKEEEERRLEDIRKEADRQAKFAAAQAIEENRKAAIKQKADEKERALAELYQRRKRENDIKKVETEFELKLRLDKVDAIQKTGLYQRQQLLGKIMGEYEQTRHLMRERHKLQDQRKMANMQASLQRQALSAAMDQIRSTKDMSKLTSGQISVSDLTRRPHTAG